MPECCQQLTIVERRNSLSIVQRRVAVTIAAGVPGPSSYELAVAQGYDGTLNEYLGLQQFTAGAVLSSNCLVAFDAAGLVIRADGPAGIPAQGFVRAAAVAGDTVNLIALGRVNGFSGLTPGAPLYLAADGQLADVVPLTGVHQQVATAATADSVLLALQPPVILA